MKEINDRFSYSELGSRVKPKPKVNNYGWLMPLAKLFYDLSIYKYEFASRWTWLVHITYIWAGISSCKWVLFGGMRILSITYRLWIVWIVQVRCCDAVYLGYQVGTHFHLNDPRLSYLCCHFIIFLESGMQRHSTNRLINIQWIMMKYTFWLNCDPNTFETSLYLRSLLFTTC